MHDDSCSENISKYSNYKYLPFIASTSINLLHCSIYVTHAGTGKLTIRTDQ